MIKEKYEIEFVLGNASQRSLWRMITEPVALAEWFADEVLLQSKTLYTFIWDKKSIHAEMVMKKPMRQVRYAWLADDNPNVYFEFRIDKMDLTGDIALGVTDFATSLDKEDAIFLWESQIDQLKRRLGI